VALSGDGGDECFAGYGRHFMAARLAPLLNAPALLRRTGGAAMALLARGARQTVVDALPLPARLRRAMQGDRLERVAQLLGADEGQDLYAAMTRLAERDLALQPEARGADGAPPLDDLVSRLIVRDMAAYLPSDILVKLDRATMAVSLEARCPILDHRVVAFAWRLPTAAKVRHGQGKWILRQVLACYVPRALFERPKQGFDVPVGAWLRGPLRGWAEDLLAAPRLRAQGLLDADAVRACWQDHLDLRRDRSRILWAVLMLQAWLEHAAAPAAVAPPAELVQPAWQEA
jgi:asparagine synthase (glutamine-hydrolysing)